MPRAVGELDRSKLKQFIILEFRVLRFIVLLIILIVIIGALQNLVMRILPWSLSMESFLLAYLLIALINILAALMYLTISHITFNMIVPAHLERCRLTHMGNCRISMLIESHKMIAAITILPLLILATMVGSATRLGLIITPEALVNIIAFGITNIYGILELTGYTLAYITPLLRTREWRISFITLALMFIVIGAYAETITLLKQLRT